MNETNAKHVMPCRSEAKNTNKDALVSVFSPLKMEYLLDHESASLYILMQHISRIQNMPMKLIRAMLEIELDLDDIHELPRDCLGDAIKFLATLHDEDETQTFAIRK